MDYNVRSISECKPTTARDYVDRLQDLIEEEDHIYKGENDNEDLSSLRDTTIGSKLGDKIFDSTVTVVLISKEMKENVSEADQWIPWEVSYSLKEQSREGKISKTNAVLAVVIPDREGRYDYYIEENTCPLCKCRNLKTYVLFQILRDNMFNIKTPEFTDCPNHLDSKPYRGYSSYIYSVKWDDFVKDINKYLDISVSIMQNILNYGLTKVVQ